MHIGQIKKVLNTPYYMHGIQLTVTSEEKYLGVMIDDRLSWTSRIEMLASEASRKLGVIMRAKLDYCCSAWDPHQKGQQRKFENVHKRAARVVIGDWSIGY